MPQPGVKQVNLVNVNYQRYINVSKHSRVYLMGAFFVIFLKSSPYFYLIVSKSLRQFRQQPLEQRLKY